MCRPPPEVMRRRTFSGHVEPAMMPEIQSVV